MSVFGYVSLAVGIVALGYAWSVRRDHRAMAGTETSSVRSITEGAFEVKGTGKLLPGVGEPLAPFTDERAIAVDYEVTERDDDEWTYEHEAGGDWANVFLVDDGTGTAFVDPAGASVDIGSDHRSEIHVEGGTTPPARVQRFLDSSPRVENEDHSLGIAGFTVSRGDDRKYEQRLIKPGDDLYVYGHATPLRESGLSRDLEERLADEGVHAVIQSEADGTFLVSNRSERELAGSKRLRFTAAAAVGVVAVVVGLVLLLGPPF